MADRRFASVRRSVALGALSALGVVLSASSAFALTLTGDAAADFTATVLADGLGQPTDVAELPDGRVVVIEKLGNVKTYTPGMADPATDKIAVVSPNNEQGLLGIVVDPDFAANQFVYFYASQGDATNRHRVLRYKLGADGKLSALKTVIDMGLMGPANHNGGGMSIYGGNLFIGVGDTGNNNSVPPRNHFGSCLNHANGKVLRVSLAEATLGQPPADNPLVDLAMVTGCDDTSPGDTSQFQMRAPDKRIYAWGFRNPFRIWADPVGGKIWVGDVGETTREEISVVDPAKGRHYGYPFYEGTHDWRARQTDWVPDKDCMGMTPASPCVAPQTDYGSDGESGAPQEAVMGGRILDGCGWPDVWKKRYIFGDHVLNKVWTADVNETRDGLVANSRKDFATSNNVTAMRMGTDNALYVVEYGSGRVTRIVAKAAPPAMPGSCLTTNPMPTMGAGGGGAGGAGGAASGGAAGTSAGGQATAGTGTAGMGIAGTETAGGSTGNGGSAAGSGATTAGTTGTAGASGMNAADSGSSGGCGCHIVGGSQSSALGLGALAALVGLALGRRRNRQ